MGMFDKRGGGSLALKLQQKILGPFGYKIRRASLSSERIEKLRVAPRDSSTSVAQPDNYSQGNVKTLYVRGTKDR